MPKYRLTVEAAGVTTTDIMAEDEEHAEQIFEEGEWKPAKENWDYYDVTEVVEVPLKDDIAASYQAGFKFVVVTDNAVHGHGSTPEEAWANALEEYHEDDLAEAECFDAVPGGNKINDWRTRDVPDVSRLHKRKGRYRPFLILVQSLIVNAVTGRRPRSSI